MEETSFFGTKRSLVRIQSPRSRVEIVTSARDTDGIVAPFCCGVAMAVLFFVDGYQAVGLYSHRQLSADLGRAWAE